MNGPTQHRPGTDCALCSAHSKAAQRHTAHPRTRTQLYLPWIVLFALSLALGAVSCTVWAIFGSSLRPVLTSAWAVRTFNIVMAILLLASLYPVFMDA